MKMERKNRLLLSLLLLLATLLVALSGKHEDVAEPAPKAAPSRPARLK